MTHDALMITTPVHVFLHNFSLSDLPHSMQFDFLNHLSYQDNHSRICFAV